MSGLMRVEGFGVMRVEGFGVMRVEGFGFRDVEVMARGVRCTLLLLLYSRYRS